MKIAFYTLGCKVNQYETQILTQLFEARGHEAVPYTGPADAYIVNSCTVTASGDQKTRKMLRRFKAQNPAAVVALTGCFPQAFPEAAAAIPEADIITGTKDRGRLPALVEQAAEQGGRAVEVRPHERGEPFEFMEAAGAGAHTRAFVKIEDGCERYCAYCIIPTARGPVRSKPPEQLRKELEGLARAGYREAVLVGINLSCYGRELGLGLADAVELACSVPGITRVRLGSLEPELLTEEGIARLGRARGLCPQFHLSLQSGCDETLRRMNRHYDTAGYARIVENLREQFDNCAITTDVMVGFPGETPEEFAQSKAFVKRMGFAKTHVFAYSRRPGTRAADMPDQVPNRDKEARAADMAEAAQAGREAFLYAQVGRTLDVLLETRGADGFYEGYAPNYAPVRVAAPEGFGGKCLPVLISGAEGDSCIGVPIL